MMLRIARDRALFDAYNRALSTHLFNTQEEAIDFARKSPAPRFYIDSDFCNIIIGRMLRGVPTGITGENQLRKYQYLFNKYKDLRKLPEYEELSLPYICDILVEMPAPEFYVSNRSARSIIAQQREKRCKEYIK